MSFRCKDARSASVDSNRVEAKLGVSLAGQTGAAADIEQGQGMLGCFAQWSHMAADPLGAQGIHGMQRGHRATGIPPVFGQSAEMGNFGFRDG